MGNRINKRKRKYIPRNTLQFQMNLTDETDREVIRIYEAATKERLALQMFRDGMRLMNALRNNDLSVLFSLFPNTRETLTPKNSELVEEFRQMIENQFKQLPLPGMQPAQTGKSLSSAVLSAPVYDDDDDNVVIRRDESAGQLSSTSFLDAAFGLKDVEMDLGTDAQHE